MLKETNTPTRPRIEPGSPDPESDALTIRPVRPPPTNVVPRFRCLFQCFQTGFCEASTALDAGWLITAPPTESPAGTGMAVMHTNVLFAPYVIPLDDTSK